VTNLKISVVTCCYNHARFLEQTIKSVLNQRYPNLEYIIIDGGSTDGSEQIIRRYSTELSYWVSEPDEGQTDALMKGFERASGDVLCWLCSDDLHEPWTLHEVGQFFSENPDARIVYGDSSWIDAEDRVIGPKKEHRFNRFIWMYDHNFIPQPSTFWKRDLYLQVGGLDKTFDVAMDADLWMRFAEITKIHHVPRPWSRMRYYPEQKVRKLLQRARQEDRRIRERYTSARSEWIYLALHICAKMMRVGWKVITHRY
jgi:glycosyltransferase involved in cell wall biosynthesis